MIRAVCLKVYPFVLSASDFVWRVLIANNNFEDAVSRAYPSDVKWLSETESRRICKALS